MTGKRKPTVKAPSKPSVRGKPRPKIDVAALAAKQGVKPIEDVDKLVEEFSDLWPNPAEIDEFLAWLRQQRREGRED